MIIRQWAAEFGIPFTAVLELERRMGLVGQQNTIHIEGTDAGSESRQQSLIRLEAADKDILLFRNNVGVLIDQRGVPVRYGLANESKHQNERIKSADLIGIRKLHILPTMVPPQGLIVGQFVSRECKHQSWQFTGTKHEQAQLAWAELINSYGGNACFATGPGTL